MQMEVTLTTNTHDHLMVPLPAHETEPAWFIHGGLVFTELTMNLLGPSTATIARMTWLIWRGSMSAKMR